MLHNICLRRKYEKNIFVAILVAASSHCKWKNCERFSFTIKIQRKFIGLQGYMSIFSALLIRSILNHTEIEVA